MDSGRLKEALPYYEKVMEKIVFKVISPNLVYHFISYLCISLHIQLFVLHIKIQQSFM